MIGRATQKRFLRSPTTSRWHIGFVPRGLAAEIAEDVIAHGEDCAAAMHNIYLDADELKVSFHVLVRKDSPAAARRVERQAGGAEGLSGDLTDEQRRLLKDRQMGLYRNTRLGQAQALKKLGDFEAALERYLRVSWLDQNGTTNLGSDGFNPNDVVVAPGITKSIAQAANTLGLDIEEIGRRFNEAGEREVEAIAPLRPVVGHDDAWANMQPLIAESIATGTKWRRPKGSA